MDSILSEPLQSSPNYCTGLANEEDAVHLHIHVLYIKHKVVFVFLLPSFSLRKGGLFTLNLTRPLRYRCLFALIGEVGVYLHHLVCASVYHFLLKHYMWQCSAPFPIFY